MFNKVISILGTLILLVLAGCRDVAPISVEEPSTENRTITLNLDITLIWILQVRHLRLSMSLQRTLIFGFLMVTSCWGI